MPSANSGEALLHAIDQLIEQYGDTHPQLQLDLQQVRTELEVLLKTRRREDFAFAALRLASWIKFILDNLPPPH
jgi:hypothetical protein